MKQKFLFVIAYLFCLDVFGQILNQEVLVFDEAPFFNSDWIKSQNIQAITADISIKKDRQPIKKTDHLLRYFFDREGRMIHRQETRDILRRRDTLETFFQYDKADNLVKVITRDAYGFFALNYVRNQSGLVVSVYHSREKQVSDGVFESLKTVWKDSISVVEKDDGMIRETYYNGYGKPYIDVLKRYNSNECLVLKREMNRIGGGYLEENYERGRNCNLIEWKIQDKTSSKWNQRKMTYNALNLLSDETFLLGGEIVMFRRFTYAQNLLLELFLERDLVKQQMRILEFSYEYFD